MNNVVDLDWYRFKREIEAQLLEINATLDDLDRQYARMIRVLAKWGPITAEMKECLERN